MLVDVLVFLFIFVIVYLSFTVSAVYIYKVSLDILKKRIQFFWPTYSLRLN